MDRRSLLSIKKTSKRLVDIEFKPLKRGRLPKPFDKTGGQRITSSGMVQVADGLHALFLLRSGESMERRAFYAWLIREESNGLLPIAALHYHPSHKGVHMLTNCETENDFTNRQLPGAPEFSLNHAGSLDPENKEDRARLIGMFCKRCGISLGRDDLCA